MLAVFRAWNVPRARQQEAAKEQVRSLFGAARVRQRIQVILTVRANDREASGCHHFGSLSQDC
jgi:hypothetical protein